MQWYMVIIYGILVTGGISSYLNYRLQKKWYDKTHPQTPVDDTPIAQEGYYDHHDYMNVTPLVATAEQLKG